MTRHQTIQRLIERDAGGHDILSLFLDMSVNSDNKRTHHVFLNKEKAAFAELQSDRSGHHREPIGAVFARIEQWLDASFDPTTKGVAIYAEIGGDWFEAIQLPVPVQNRLVILDHAVISPLTEVLQRLRRYGIVMVDREHLRLLSVHAGTVDEDYSLSPDAIPTPHDVQAGGYSHKDYQKRKAEETRHFFRDFAEEIERFHARTAADHYVLLGTTENTQKFREFLPRAVADRVLHTAHSPLGVSAHDLLQQLAPVFEQVAEQNEAQTLDLLQERVGQAHFATAGFHDTLVQLQEGKVERLVVARGSEKDGAQCTQCSFYLVRRDGSACPYCGGALRDGIDLVESMVRMAATQSIPVHFVAGDAMSELSGVGALLKF
jgi:peptide subunit release factor 1 (eRF1)